MNTLSKHYYLALSYYYISNNISLAQEECLLALDFSPQNEEILSLLKAISNKQSTTTTFDKYLGQIFQQIISKQEIDAFLMLFFALNGFQLPKNICWDYLKEDFVPTLLQHQIWDLLCKNDWRRAYSHATTMLIAIQGNPIVYFQLGILFFEQKNLMTPKIIFLYSPNLALYTQLQHSLCY